MKPGILYFYPNEASYIEKDIRILEEKFTVTRYRLSPSEKLKLPFRLFRQLIFCLTGGRKSYFVCMFAGYHSVIPVFIGHLLGVKTVIIPGGSDCASFPEINYGNFRKKWLGRATAYSLKNAGILSPIHEKMIEYTYDYENFKQKKQGFLSFCGPVKGRIKVVYNGFYTGQFNNFHQPRSRSFVSIATYNREAVYYLKGIDLLEKAAVHFPETQFTVIGVSGEFMKQERPDNLIFLPFMPQEQIIQHLNNHMFYCQLSISEGFPNALGEAMLCGCIPLVSKVSSMPDIVGHTGFVLNKRDEDELMSIIQTMLDLSETNTLSEAARQRILSEFSFERRKKELLDLLT